MDKDRPRLVFGAAIVLLVLALVSVLSYALMPLIAGSSSEEPGFFMSILPVAAMVMVVLSGLLFLAGCLLYIYEIATAKNDGTWKAIWIVLILVLGVLGVIAYELAGRKERKD